MTEAADAIFEIDPTSDAPIPKLTALLDEPGSGDAVFGRLRARSLWAAARRRRFRRSRRCCARTARGTAAAAPRSRCSRSTGPGTTAIPAICDVANAPLPGVLQRDPGLDPGSRSQGLSGRGAHATARASRALLAIARDYELAEVLLNLALDPKDLVPVLAELMHEDPTRFRTARSCAPTRRAPSRSPSSRARGRCQPPRFGSWPSSSSFHSVRRGRTQSRRSWPSCARAGDSVGGGSERVRRALWALAVIGLPARSVAALAEDVRRASASPRRTCSRRSRASTLTARSWSHAARGQLAESPFGVRMTAADDLAWLGPKAAAAVPALLRALADVATDEAKVRLIEALGAIGPGAAEARPVLLAQLGDVDSLFARSARWALGAIGCPLTPSRDRGARRAAARVSGFGGRDRGRAADRPRRRVGEGRSARVDRGARGALAAAEDRGGVGDRSHRPRRGSRRSGLDARARETSRRDLARPCAITRSRRSAA